MPLFSTRSTVKWLDRQDKRVASAAVALCDNGGRVIVVKANYKPYWTFPGGIVDAGETPRQAAVREVMEEVGITVVPELLEFCMVASRSSAVAQTFQFVFSQSIDSSQINDIIMGENEIDEWAMVSREEIMAGDRHYSQSVLYWAQGHSGYVEQRFDRDSCSG